MKRKDFENAYDDEVSFAASAPKSRRLDGGLPPIFEEEFGSGVGMVPDQRFLHENFFAGAGGLVPNEGAIPVCPVVENDPPSQELAIVLYNPENAVTQGMVKSPCSSDFSLVISPKFLSGWKSYMLHQNNQSRLTITELNEESDDDKKLQLNSSIAVVPWVGASQQQPYVTVPDDQAPVMGIEPMEADADCEMMEFDDNTSASIYNSNQGYTTNNGMVSGEPQPALPLQHQQPDSLLPQYAPNAYTPIPL